MEVKALVQLEELPLWQEIWFYLRDTYLTDNNVYENLDLGTGTLISVRMIIIGLFIGLIIAGFSAVFNKRVLGDFVRKMIAEEAFSPEKAMTLAELGYADKFAIANAVRRNPSLKRVVKCVEEEEFDRQLAEKISASQEEGQNDPKEKRVKETFYKVNAKTDRFYIPEEMRYMADVKFEAKGTTWRGAISFTILALVAMIALIVAMPYILDLVNDLAGAIKNL